MTCLESPSDPRAPVHAGRGSLPQDVTLRLAVQLPAVSEASQSQCVPPRVTTSILKVPGTGIGRGRGFSAVAAGGGVRSDVGR